jgi:hypothetical protein
MNTDGERARQRERERETKKERRREERRKVCVVYVAATGTGGRIDRQTRQVVQEEGGDSCAGGSETEDNVQQCEQTHIEQAILRSTSW